MLFLDDFLEMLEELPVELRERCTEIREIDSEISVAVERNRKAIAAFFERAATMSPEQNETQLKMLQAEYRRLRSRAEEKVAMAERMQELLEKYTQHLEREKTHFKYELEVDNPGVTDAIEKRFSEYVESMMALRKERRKRTASGISTTVVAATPSPAPSTVTPAALPHGVRHGSVSVERRERGAPGGPPPAKLARTESLGRQLDVLGEEEVSQLPTLSALIRGRKPSQPFNEDLLRMRGRESRASSTAAPLSALSLPTPSGGLSPALPATPNPVVDRNERWTPSSADGTPHSYSPASSHHSGGPGAFPSFASPPSSAMPNFTGLESRHGRPRKLTTRVQEMFKEKELARQERVHRHPALPHFPPQEEEEAGSDSEEEAEDQRTWCVCNQKSYGNMVACDNRECPYEWFHYHCVGIDAPPKGKWFCPHCTQQRARRAAS